MQGSGTERAEADGDRTATMLLAAFAVVLGVCAVLGGLAVWKVYRQRQVGHAAVRSTLGSYATSSSIGVLLHLLEFLYTLALMLLTDSHY